MIPKLAQPPPHFYLSKAFYESYLKLAKILNLNYFEDPKTM